MSRSVGPGPAAPLPAPRFRRSPLLLVEWQGRDLVVVHADSQRRFRSEPSIMTVLAHLEDWTTLEELNAVGSPLTVADMDRLVEFGVVERELDADVLGAAEGWVWDANELTVHRRSNTGGFRESALTGVPPPVFKPRPDGVVTPLPEPAARLSEPLGDVLGRRRSVRRYGDRPLGLDELSSLLHHAARIIASGRHETLGDYALRPFPGGGARSELELYVVAQHVAGLAPGAHYFDPRSHALVQIRSSDDHHKSLVQWTHAATGGMLNRDPAVILLVTAVFGRVMWKYRGISLSLIYKDTGCLIQTLYLVATSLGLAPCAIGGGEERANSTWLGLDPLLESQVGCMLLGPRDEA